MSVASASSFPAQTRSFSTCYGRSPTYFSVAALSRVPRGRLHKDEDGDDDGEDPARADQGGRWQRPRRRRRRRRPRGPTSHSAAPHGGGGSAVHAALPLLAMIVIPRESRPLQSPICMKRLSPLDLLSSPLLSSSLRRPNLRRNLSKFQRPTAAVAATTTSVGSATTGWSVARRL